MVDNYKEAEPGTDGISGKLVVGDNDMELEPGTGGIRDKLARLQIKGEHQSKTTTYMGGDEVEPGTDGASRVSVATLKGLRRRKWETKYGWNNEDLDRKLKSCDALPENLQDYEKEMVLFGSGVVNLYPNLKVDKMVDTMREAVEKSCIKWEEVDYREAMRYLALNWDLETCRKSNLRRVLQVRRGKRGTRPGLKGTLPCGPTKGDQEQWIFRDIILEEWEKKKIIAEVVSLATKAMLKNHYYTFWGKVFHQNEGGLKRGA